MNYYRDIVQKTEYYRANETAPQTIEVPGAGDDPVSSTAQGPRTEKTGEKDTLATERENELALWMEDIKAFIRKIDVSRL